MKSFGKGTRTIEEEIDGILHMLEYLSVDVCTGICTWSNLIRQGKVKVGDVAGTLSKKGYTSIEFDGSSYQRHRIVFYVAKGYLPLIVDHVRGVEAGDGIDNLQEATNKQNSQKQRKSKSNTSGYRGVYLYKPTGRWQASIRVDGKNIHLGYYDTPEEAHIVYENKAKSLYGNFYVEPSKRDLL